MKKTLTILIVIIVLGAVGYTSWYLLLKKSPEGGTCTSSQKCEQNLQCIDKVCSSGKAGSSCLQKSDCKTNFCVNNRCSEGNIGDTCKNHKDCQSELLCQKNSCIKQPDYSKYFDKVVISKMRPGMPPGHDNPLTETTIFNKTDGIEVDFEGVKPETVGEYYIELINANTGEVANSTQNKMDTKFDGQDIGMGTDLGMMSNGDYDLNVYYKNNLVYSTQITIK